MPAALNTSCYLVTRLSCYVMPRAGTCVTPLPSLSSVMWRPPVPMVCRQSCPPCPAGPVRVTAAVVWPPPGVLLQGGAVWRRRGAGRWRGGRLPVADAGRAAATAALQLLPLRAPAAHRPGLAGRRGDSCSPATTAPCTGCSPTRTSRTARRQLLSSYYRSVHRLLTDQD